ncbi:copper homeostasis membrane protein CopD [Yersinia enterocolitica]|jgi:putative copper resistance protein D|uniref:copper homeostasis membrane protein CopD n=1 Tax=Yersiniaceae TaxID=1903411 RepID=UPI0003D81DD8|nr:MULTISPECIES: copper homeostasis membrane protein CopD [Yersiniaceae]EKN3385342.1 copper homeostasis membrane protein CopD [Yersinia enterocolitica]EKN3584846.1 copper homeostasis membrane protein CopD [Yersinia enterocolitica]EKN3765374.1 copper homeostasis membrane protein CopD [Yersinia enterocolitica]EKN3970956.1 copper homeostasis membrane protein CopD [Yersinia enterocolitica]EKN4081593.1 copper homeostasis membrane protein CopD [Yersinia enterocolitica]
MNDQIMIIVRFFLYLDLMLIFGLPFFEIYGINKTRRETGSVIHFRSFIFFAIISGIVLTFFNMLLVSNAMSGVTDFRELSIHIIEMVIEETEVGVSWVIRLIALFIALSGILLYERNQQVSRWITTLAGTVALATLAWGGHAVMHDGIHYYLHLFSDLVHLVAAGTWVGALAAFAILLLRKGNHNKLFVEVVSESLAGFATAGTIIVVALSLSAAVNYVYITEGVLSVLVNSSWGLLLLAKTGLFGLMLLLAAANRFHLGPRLERTVSMGEYSKSISLMRRSILTEFFIAIIILAAVAWLGMLSPSAMGE